MAERVHLDQESELQLLDLAQANDPIEDHLPILVPRKIVVGDEEAAQSLGHVFADDLLDVIGRPAARLPSLHVDDGAERTLERATASRVEAGHVARGALGADGGDQRDRHSFDAGQVRHEIASG